MVWGAHNSGYYANVPGGQVQCQPRITVNPGGVTDALDARPSMMVVGSSRITARCRVIGVPNGDMASFRGSFARNFGGAEVVVGFIQILTASTRVAYYGALPQRMKLWRNPAPIGAGILDCGVTQPPWFQGTTARLMPATPGGTSPPAMVSCGDNPRWTVPEAVPSPHARGVDLSLESVQLRNSFLLFAVAKVAQAWFPICRTRWETNITWQAGQGLLAQVTNSVPWGPVTPQDAALLITNPGAPTANGTLTNQLVPG